MVSWGGNNSNQVSNTPAGNDFVGIAAGDSHSVAVRSDGTIVAWGSDTYGQVSQAPATNGFVSVAAGDYHCLALRTDGLIVSWGDDARGEVSNTPEGYDFAAIAGGRWHSVALKFDGTLVSWGSTDYGMVSNTPKGGSYVAVSAGRFHSLALWNASVPTCTPTLTCTPTATSTATSTNTPTSTSTATPTLTSSPTATSTFTSTSTATPTPTATATPDNGWVRTTTDGPISGLLLYGDKGATTRDMGGIPAIPSPFTQQVLPHYASNNTWYTGVTVANPNASQANVDVAAYSGTGGLIETAHLTVPAYGKVAKLVSVLFSSAATGSGWIKVTSDVPVVAFDLYGDKVSGGIGALPGTQGDMIQILPHFVHSNRWWTGIAVVNVGSVSTSVGIKAYSATGTLIQETTQPLNSGSKLTGILDLLLPLTAQKSGWILMESSASPIAAILVYGDKNVVPNRIAALTGMTGSLDRKLSLFRNKAEWWTGISVVNPSGTTTANLTLIARRADGTEIDQTVQTLPLLNKTVGMASTLFDMAGATEGWVDVLSDIPVVGFELLNVDDATNGQWGLAGVEMQPASTSLSFAHYISNTRWWTLFALVNPQVTAVNRHILIYDNNGLQRKDVAATAPAESSDAGLVNDLFGF